MVDGAKPNLLTTAEAAKRLRCSRQHIYGLVRAGKLKALHLGSKILIASDVIDRMLAEAGVNQDRPAA